MKRIFVITLCILYINLKANCQITKGNWMIGGNATFTSNNVHALGFTNKYTEIQLSPAGGYFLANKLAAGLKFDVNFYIDRRKSSFTNSTVGNVSHYIFGPFARYYLLEQENRVNLFAEGSYAYGILRTNNTVTTATSSFYHYTFLAGPVVYFNQSVGIEFTIGYYHSKNINIDNSKNSFQMGLGLQVHLEKDK